MFRAHYQNGETSSFETEEESISAVNFYGGTVYTEKGDHVWSSFNNNEEMY